MTYTISQDTLNKIYALQHNSFKLTPESFDDASKILDEEIDLMISVFVRPDEEHTDLQTRNLIISMLNYIKRALIQTMQMVKHDSIKVRNITIVLAVIKACITASKEMETNNE